MAPPRAPNVDDLTLTAFLNKFRNYRAMDPVENQPKPDMIAARYALTGLSQNGRHVAGINTVRDKLGPRATTLPFIRRDFDSLIGFSADIPVSKDVTYFPNPTLTRTLSKSVYVKYTYNVGEEVRRLGHYILIESTDNSYSFMFLSLRPSWTATTVFTSHNNRRKFVRHGPSHATFPDCHAHPHLVHGAYIRQLNPFTRNIWPSRNAIHHRSTTSLIFDVTTQLNSTQWITVDPSKVPNVYFGTFGPRHTLRLFFPRLQDSSRQGVNLTNTELGDIYDLGIRQAAQDVLRDTVHDWPTSFTAARFKDRNHGTGFVNAGLIISALRLSDFDQRIRYRIDTEPVLEWAADYFWGTEIRGVKDAYTHPISKSEAERLRILKSVTQDIDTTSGIWYIDVGLEFILGGQALLWSTDSHSQIMQAALGIDAREANSIISTRSKYFRDVSTHLESLSGFRAILDENSRNNRVSAVYVHAYTSDKSQTYHPENGRYGKTLTLMEATHGNPPPWCQNLLDLYRDAARNVDVAARIEVRCPLEFAEECLITFPEDELRTFLTCYKREIWW